MPRGFYPKKKRYNNRRKRRKLPLVKLIKKVIDSNAEHLYNTATGVTITLSTGLPFIGSLAGIQQGTDVDDRSGIIVKPTRLRMRYRLTLVAPGIVASVRVYIIQNMTDVDPLGLPDTDDLMPTLKQAKNAYRILYDRTHELSLGIHQDLRQEVYIKGSKMIELRFDGASANDFTRGDIHFNFVTDHPEINEIEASFQSHLYFTDD